MWLELKRNVPKTNPGYFIESDRVNLPCNNRVLQLISDNRTGTTANSRENLELGEESAKGFVS